MALTFDSCPLILTLGLLLSLTLTLHPVPGYGPDL